jgi:ParB family chromosome partitioning protein
LSWRRKWRPVAKPKPGMGRGLEAILSVSAEGSKAHEDELRELPVELIAPNPKQPRRRFDEESLQALAGSLGARGVLQPVLVRAKPGGTYDLIAGERRWRAARMAGLESIPALVRPRGDAEVLELALIENMAREDLNPVEEARACAALVEELGLTRAEVAKRVGRGRVAVSNLIRLLDLPEETIELMQEGALSEGHGRALLLAEDHGARRSLARTAVQEGWSVRTAEARARESNGDTQATRGGARRKERGGREAHPDQVQAAKEIAETLSEALGTEVHVKAMWDGGYRAELEFATPEEALDLAARIRRPRAISSVG